MNTHQISDTIENIYGFETSEGFDVTDKFLPQTEEKTAVKPHQFS